VPDDTRSRADEQATKEVDEKFVSQIAAKQARKLKAQARVTRTVWSGLGMMGMVGWSVVVPTLLGAALGVWLDNHYPAMHSWMLTLLAIGLAIGCVNAWHWIVKEEKEILWDQETTEKGDDEDE
jgi:ATP synthase protein I